MLAVLFLAACATDPQPGTAPAETGSPTSAPGPAVDPGDYAFTLIDLLEDDCGVPVFDQEIRRFDEARDLTTLLDVPPVPCDVDAEGFLCGPGSLAMPFYPGSSEVLSVSAVVSGDGMEALVEREVDGACSQVFEVSIRPLFPEDELAPVPCADESTLASGASATQTRFDVVNATDRELAIAWLDYNGERAPSEPIAAGSTWTAGVTFAGHPFVVTEASGDCLAIALPDAEYGALTVE